jgi:hypothetical protein
MTAKVLYFVIADGYRGGVASPAGLLAILALLEFGLKHLTCGGMG